MLELQKIFLLVRFFNRISCNKGLKAKISRFFMCFFCLTPLRLDWLRDFFFNFAQKMGLIVHGSYINGLSEKILIWGKWVILIQDPECHILSQNSGSAVRIVLQFCTMKGAKTDMEIILMVFLKEILLYSEQIVHFGTKIVWRPLHFESALRFSY